MSNQLLFSSTSMDAAKAAFWNGVLAPCRLLLLAYAVETEDMAVLPNWSPDLGSSQKIIYILLMETAAGVAPAPTVAEQPSAESARHSNNTGGGDNITNVDVCDCM